jgi:nitrilase
MKVAALQMVSGVSVINNLASAKQLIQAAAENGAELVLLPEYFCILGQRDTDKIKVAEIKGKGLIQTTLSEAAIEHKIWIVGGSLPLAIEGTDNKVTNTSLVFNPQGQCVARYDKVHLFRFDNGNEGYDEANTLVAGQVPAIFELPSKDGHVWNVGLSICYDVRFPEFYRKLADHGVELALVPSAFTHTTGQAHWEVLLRARAIENQFWVVAAAQGGVHENLRRTWGQSMIIDPWGRIVAEIKEGPGCILYEMNSSIRDAITQQLPALTHRKIK